MVAPYRMRPLLFVAALAVLAAGCSGGASIDPKVVQAERERLTLAEEPDGAQTVLDVRAAMFGEEAAEAAKSALAAAVASSDHDETAHAEHDHAEHNHADHEHAHAEHAHAEHDHAEHDHDPASHDHADHHHELTPKVSELAVILVGSVGGVANPSKQSHPDFPFAKSKAMFFLADPEAAAAVEEHGHAHAPGEECAFCAAHAADMAHAIAAVQFKDERGKVIPIDVRELFDLKEKETVVVEGVAKVAVGGMITVDATGIYIRR